MGNRAGKRHELAVGEHRRDERHVRHMRQAAFIRMVGDEHIAIADAAGHLPLEGGGRPRAAGGRGVERCNEFGAALAAPLSPPPRTACGSPILPLQGRVIGRRAVLGEDAGDEVAIDGGVEEHRRRDDQPAVAVEDHAEK